MNNWKETTLGEVTEYIGRGISPSYSDKGVLIVNQKCIRDKKVSFDEARFTDPEIKNILKEKLLKSHDILVCSTGTGTLGRVGQLKEIKKEITVDSHVSIVRASNKTDSIFLGYLLKGKEREIELMAEGSTGQTELPRRKLQEFKVKIPLMGEQKQIAAVLLSLDDKIELLRAENVMLEKIAQGIFKEWFVNFKIDGKRLRLRNNVPEGWRIGKMGDEFNITIGRTPPRGESEWFSTIPTGRKWISIKNMGNNEVYISNTSEYLTDEAVKKFNIPIIPENTTILSFKMTVGRLAITTEEMLSNEAIAHLKIKENSNLSTEFIYSFLKGLDFNSLGSTSSIVTAINSTMIKEMKVLVPEKEIMQKYNKVIQPIFAKLKINNSQIQTLSHLRDTLLPKLMSGETGIV